MRPERTSSGAYVDVPYPVSDTARIKINGCARHVGKDSPHDIRNGAGLTFGVDADVFARWLEQNKDSDLVRKGLVFAQAKQADVEAQAKEHRKERTGLEPIDPKNLPPEFKGKVETAAAA